MFDGKALGDQIVSHVRGFVSRALSTFSARLDELESRINNIPPAQKGDPGENGKSVTSEEVYSALDAYMALVPPPKNGEPGQNGKDADPAVIREMVLAEVAKAVAAIPPPKNGEPGAAGKDADSIHPDTIALMVVNEVAKAVAAIPKPENGDDGEPGRDATHIEILPAIDPTKSYPRNTFAEYRGGTIRAARNTDPITGKLQDAGWVVSMNGIHEETEDISEDGRTITRTVEYTDGKTRHVEFKVAAIQYRGIWTESENYDKGDVAVTGGCSYHCQVSGTKQKPGTLGADDWKMMVKAGRDGRSAYKLACDAGFRGTEAEWLKSLKGEPGRPGKDKD